MLFQETLAMVKELDEEVMEKAQTRLDNLSKPLGSLGRLEEIAKRVAGITGKVFPKVDRKAVIIMCADNGVVEEGVTQTGKEVTSIVTRNFEQGITGINVLSAHAGAEIVVVDMGVDDVLPKGFIIDKKIRRGTWNIAKGPAMTRDEAVRAIEAGIEIVRDLKDRGINLLGTGEMGIGNTSTSSAIVSVLTSSAVEDVVGRGAGLSNEGLKKKVGVVGQAIAVNQPVAGDPLDVLAKLGGFDIAGLTGCFIGAAAYRIPILMDGFISGAAALLAVAIEPRVKDYIFPSHGSAEPGTKKIMKALGFEPYLNLEMRLGEGTGAALAFHVMDAALVAYTRMGTFDDARIEQYTPQD